MWSCKEIHMFLQFCVFFVYLVLGDIWRILFWQPLDLKFHINFDLEWQTVLSI